MDKPKATKRTVVDEFTNLPVSRQRRWQLRQAKAGCCIICGKPAVRHLRCEPHAEALVVRMREDRRKKLDSRRRNAGARSYSFTAEGCALANEALK